MIFYLEVKHLLFSISRFEFRMHVRIRIELNCDNVLLSNSRGDTQFHFRTRLCPFRKKSMGMFKDYNKDCLVALQVSWRLFSLYKINYLLFQVDPTHFYGYVYFRQVKDRSARRGYFQKSLVLLTRFPFVCLYSQIVQIIAPQFFECGEASLEAGKF